MAAESEEARRRDIRELEDRCRAEMQVRNNLLTPL